MAATVDVVEGNGAGPTWTVITAARYCNADNYNPGTSTPVVVPAATGYSWWKTHALKITAGGYTQITNLRFFTDGTITWTLGTGGMVKLAQKSTADKGVPAANYDQATGSSTTGDYFDDATLGHTFYKSGSANYSAPVNITTYTTGSPMQVDNTTVYSGAVSATYGVVHQILIASDATQGTQAAETFTFRWDEI